MDRDRAWLGFMNPNCWSTTKRFVRHTFLITFHRCLCWNFRHFTLCVNHLLMKNLLDLPCIWTLSCILETKLFRVTIRARAFRSTNSQFLKIFDIYFIQNTNVFKVRNRRTSKIITTMIDTLDKRRNVKYSFEDRIVIQKKGIASVKLCLMSFFPLKISI